MDADQFKPAGSRFSRFGNRIGSQQKPIVFDPPALHCHTRIAVAGTPCTDQPTEATELTTIRRQIKPRVSQFDNQPATVLLDPNGGVAAHHSTGAGRLRH